MQNSGLATALAQNNLPQLALAPVPGALFSVWHNIAGGLLAPILRKWVNAPDSTDTPAPAPEK